MIPPGNTTFAAVSKPRLKFALVFVLIALWFFGHAWRGLFAGFQDDDMMNLYHAWILPWYQLIAANLVPFTPVYRPLGSALYRILYLVAGLHPLPFRLCAYALMTLNIWLIFRLAKLLTGSTEIAVVAALIGSYHHRLMDIYLNNGTIYDVLCFTFYYLSLCFYIAARRQGNLTWRQIAGFCALYSLALNSKEMAVTLPVILLVYEWIYHPAWMGRAPVNETETSLAGDQHRSTVSEGNLGIRVHSRSFAAHNRVSGPGSRLLAQKTVWISAIITALAIFAKTGSSSPFAGNADYAVHFSLHQFLSNLRPNTAELLFLPPGQINTVEVLAFFVLIWGIAIASRQKHLLFAAALFTIAPLPAEFIHYRGFFVMYLAYPAVAIYAASFLVGARDWLWRVVWKRSPLPADTWQPERVFLFLLTAWFLFSFQHNDPSRSFDRIDPSQPRIGALEQALLRIHPPNGLSKGVLFLRDPFVPEDFDPLFVVRLFYNDSAIPVDRVKTMPAGSSPSPDRYSLVLDYCGDQFVEIMPAAPDRCTE